GNENRLYLFLDEIQNVENAGMILKFLYDEFPHIKIIFSGSSSLEIRKRILPSLVGRLFLFNLYSFSFCEFVEARDTGLRKIIDNRKKGLEKIVKTLELLKDKDKEKNYDLLHEIIDKMPKPAFVDEVIALLKEYMIWGGYPEVIKTSDGELKKTILQNIITLYLEKDIISFFKIRDSTKFFKLSTLLATQPGGFVVNSEISSELHLSRNTVDSYLEILQHSYIIHLLSPYHKNLRNELRKQEKIYFLDHGIRNALISNFTPFDNRSGPEKGCLLENFVFGELLKKLMPYLEGYEVKYWRTTNKTEVDFVLVSKSNSLLIPIEVKLGGKKVSRGFYSFIREYGIKLAFVATLNVFKIEKHDDFTMLWIPVYYF
ncbi:MAG: ATP-binding protein, partial [Promethearchaeota archaeon]